MRNYGSMLVELARAIPDGIVCFFVSYSYMDAIVSKWNDMGVLQACPCLMKCAQCAALPLECMCPAAPASACRAQSGDHGAAPVPLHTPPWTRESSAAQLNVGVLPQELMGHKLVFIETVDVVETTLALDNFRHASRPGWVCAHQLHCGPTASPGTEFRGLPPG